MKCLFPLEAWRARTAGPSGKRRLVFKQDESSGGTRLEIPCGQCINCRLEYSRQWAVRCMHEASMHLDNSFVTLTYDDDNLPPDHSLHKEHFQKFMKRLRRRIGGQEVRYFHCGEYGEKLGRPHYHACLFGYDFPDKSLHSERDGTKLYTSPFLADLWPFGFSTTGDVTFESAAYVARYVTKKVTGDEADDYYMYVDPVTGVVHPVQPEYATMSRKRAIGRDWYEKYKAEVFPSDEVIVNGRKAGVPKAYFRLLEAEAPEVHREIKEARRTAMNKLPRDTRYVLEKDEDGKLRTLPGRLQVIEKCVEARVSNLKRGMEDEF